MKNLIVFVLLLSTVSIFAQNQIKGFAVYYADYFQDRPTANGEIYDEMKYTAASRNYPFGTILKVTRLDKYSKPTSSIVYVRVNDRGPFAKECPECILDLSWIAADEIGLTLDGKVEVFLEEVGHSTKPISGPLLAYSGASRQQSIATYQQAPVSNYASNAYTKRTVIKNESIGEWESNFVEGGTQLRSKGLAQEEVQERKTNVFGYNSGSAQQSMEVLTGQNNINTIREGYGIQLASYVDKSNAFRYFDSLKQKGLDDIYIITSQMESKTYFKIVKGNFSSKVEADNALYNLNRDTKYRGFVLLLSK